MLYLQYPNLAIYLHDQRISLENRDKIPPGRQTVLTSWVVQAATSSS